MTTWCYWSGFMPPAIELCVKSLRLHNPDFRLVDEGWMQEQAPDLVELVEGRSHQVRADLYRLWLLAEHGGQWVDADCVALRRLDMQDQLSESVDMVSFSNGSPNHISNAILAANKNSDAIRQTLQQAIEVVKRHKPDEKIQYGATGQGVLGYIKSQFGSKLKVCQRWRWAPIRFTDVDAFRQHRHDGGHSHASVWHPNARTYHFTGKGLLPLANKTRDQILTGRSFASFLFRRSLGRVRPLRAREILKRVPPGERIIGCEVGVHRAQNASVILQQRPDLQMHLVDMWSTNDRYIKSGDAIAKRSQSQRNNDYQSAKQTIAFAQDRVMLHRGQSAAEAGEFSDRSLDFVFIDADHSYEGCKTDIVAWLTKVKPGGWIGGHDYGHRLERSGKWGVKRAVDEAAAKHNLIVETGQDLTWFAKV